MSKSRKADDPHGTSGPVVVLVTFSIMLMVAVGVWLAAKYGPKPPAVPAPPEAKMLPTMLYPVVDAGPTPTQP